MESNVFQFASDTQSKTVQKIKSGVQKYLIFIVLLFNVTLEITSRLYRFGLQNTFTPEFFVDFFITTATSMLCYICFIPFGRADEMKQSTIFQEITKEWETLTAQVRKGNLQLFQKFCVYQVKQERAEAKKYILTNYTLINYETYSKEYEPLSKKQLRKLYKDGEINKDEYTAIKKCYKIKVKPINPLIVLQGAKKTTVNDAGRDDSSYALNKAIQRPIIMFIASFIINTITTTFIGNSENVWLEMMLSIFSIIISSVMGYSTGVNDFKHSEDRIKARVLFISLFFGTDKTVYEGNKDIRGTGIYTDLQEAELQSQENNNCN